MLCHNHPSICLATVMLYISRFSRRALSSISNLFFILFLIYSIKSNTPHIHWKTAIHNALLYHCEIKVIMFIQYDGLILAFIVIVISLIWISNITYSKIDSIYKNRYYHPSITYLSCDLNKESHIWKKKKIHVSLFEFE